MAHPTSHSRMLEIAHRNDAACMRVFHNVTPALRDAMILFEAHMSIKECVVTNTFHVMGTWSEQHLSTWDTLDDAITARDEMLASGDIDPEDVYITNGLNQEVC